MTIDTQCFVCRESQASATPTLQLVVIPVEGEQIALSAHTRCLESWLNPSAQPRDPATRGTIPPDAHCGRCGQPIGATRAAGFTLLLKHPLLLEVLDSADSRQWWLHQGCSPLHSQGAPSRVGT